MIKKKNQKIKRKKKKKVKAKLDGSSSEKKYRKYI